MCIGWYAGVGGGERSQHKAGGYKVLNNEWKKLSSESNVEK